MHDNASSITRVIKINKLLKITQKKTIEKKE